jgi:uncharacterized protein involved in type VI secretion and phage assembly
MGSHLLDVLSPSPHESGRVYGVVVGIVTNNKDPDNMARVKVRFPWLSDDEESWWARIATVMAGKNRGSYFIPEVDDEVLVAFDHGDMRFPYILGSVWNGKDTSPENNSDGENNIREIKSRSGHIIRLDDKDGKEKITIVDKTGGNQMVIDSSDNSIQITCTQKMTLHAQDIEINADSSIKINAGTSLDVQAGTSVDVQAGTTMDLNATAPVTIKGATVSIN